MSTLLLYIRTHIIIYILMCMRVSVCRHVHAMVHLWRSEDNIQDSGLSFPMGAGDQTQASKFATASSLPTEPYRWLLMFFFLSFKEFFMHMCVPV